MDKRRIQLPSFVRAIFKLIELSCVLERSRARASGPGTVGPPDSEGFVKKRSALARKSEIANLAVTVHGL